MSTGTQVCDIVLPGYTLVDRIGSGGYAEVWRAEAPGGLQKAVKVVYGYYDDEFASQELKALERIKGVRHPFLLSLERFEIVNGRLAILTELADMSLDQRLRQCKAEGLGGIPREELLRYMADAAEALDFLAQRHSLLHLDIKPENLLVLGDHIKVADFGLVKELASRTQNSLVSGMTPSYASPEMFDDDPSAHSDQYSLAIVYQEMLVGTLPFPGRTAAQLAKQHMQAEPQLMSLPAQDRSIVGKVLAKKPAERFPSCRAFVDALYGRNATPEMPRPIPTAPAPPVPSEIDTKPPSFCTTLLRSPGQSFEERKPNVTQPVGRGGAAALAAPPPVAPLDPWVPEEAADVAMPEFDQSLMAEQPTLFVAIGGVGIQTLCRFRTLAAARDAAIRDNEAIESLALDTDRDELREATSSRWPWPVSSEDIQHLPLRLPKSYDNAREILGWVSKRWLYNIPRSLETRGYRPLGRVALVDHSLRVLAMIDQKLQRLAALAGSLDGSDPPRPRREEKIRIVLLAGMGGGTGAGMAIDVANAVRSLASARGIRVEVQGFLLCTCFANATSSPLVAANTYAMLTELSHATSYGNAPLGAQMQANSFESDHAPFDCVYCVPSQARTAESAGQDALNTVAKYLALETLPAVRAALRSCRKSRTAKEEARRKALVLKKIGYASLEDRKRDSVQHLAVELAEAIRHYWLGKDASADWEKLVRAERQASSVPKIAPAAEDAAAAHPAVVPYDDATPLALRGRFREWMGTMFASEFLLAVQNQIGSKDDRGRPLLLAREAKPIVDAAREVASVLMAQPEDRAAGGARFAGSPVLRTLVEGGSQLVLRRAIERFDPKQPERALSLESIEVLLHDEVLKLLEGSFKHPELAAALGALVDVDQAVAQTVAQATTDLLQCGCDRRTLVIAPAGQLEERAQKQLFAARPLASVVAAEVDDMVVVSEEAGISPRSLAMGLERVFPGIAEAARRLHTRIDIDWKHLV